MKTDYSNICKAAPEFATMASLEDFMKVRALVNSRIFGIKIKGEENDSIVPYAGTYLDSLFRHVQLQVPV